MDISRFKDIILRLSVLKDYSSLSIPVVIGLAAVLVFIPTQLMSGKLKSEISKESISMGKSVQSLGKNPVARGQWKVEQEYQRAFESDSNQVTLLARQSTERPLLSYKIFPEPKDTSMLIFEEFGQQFRDVIDGLITRANAHQCPTDAELERNLQGSGSSSGIRRATRKSFQRLSELESTIVDIICRDKAESASFYANPAGLAGYEFWERYEYSGMKNAIEDCWYSQLSYWIIEDVINTIAYLNSGSNSVFTSPVKRLMSVDFTLGQRQARSREGERGNRPRYVLSIEEGFTTPWTGRYCNDDIDVVHFNFAVVVSAKAVLPFMEQLCSVKQHKFRGFSGNEPEQVFGHNQITILESNIWSIDREYEIHNLYRYGEDAVVELDLICEYQFNKNGYNEIKPESVKELLKKVEK